VGSKAHVGVECLTGSLAHSINVCIYGLYTQSANWCVKVKLYLALINQAPHHEDVLGSGDIAPPFLTSALDGGEWSAPRPAVLTPENRPRFTG
jgi:hypothetical protein